MSPDIANAPRWAEPPPAGNHCAREQLSPGQPSARGFHRTWDLVGTSDGFHVLILWTSKEEVTCPRSHSTVSLDSRLCSIPADGSTGLGVQTLSHPPRVRMPRLPFSGFQAVTLTAAEGWHRGRVCPPGSSPAARVPRLLSFLAKCFPTPHAARCPGVTQQPHFPFPLTEFCVH